MVENLEASEPLTASAYDDAHDDHFELPANLDESIRELSDCEELHEILGTEFVQAFCAVKRKESETFNKGITAWEREHLQLLV